VLSPNDVRLEEGWPASSGPTADSIEPPVAGGKPAEGSSEAASQPNDDEAGKVARLDQHRTRHGSD